MFRIVTDTSANLPTAYLQQEHITIIPFTFHADGDEQACLDLNTFDAKTFYAQMRSGTKVSTSQIPPQRYLDVLTPMLEAGEDPLYVARRLTRFASEDVGLADPHALEIAVAVYQACHLIGMPECSVHLTQAVVYLSLAPKSNALYVAYEQAKKDALRQLAEPVPLVIRNAPTSLMAELNYGKGYQYAHDTQEKLTNMQCLPDSLLGREYYVPTEQGVEGRFKARLAQIKQWKQEHKAPKQGK